MYEWLLILAGTTALIYFSYSAGKNKVLKEINEEALDDLNKAIEARDSIKSGDDAKRLLLEHKRL